MRVVVLLLTLGSFLLSALPVEAHPALPPGPQPIKYSRWAYPTQVAYGPIENGTGSIGQAAAPGAFLTLPFMGPHYVTSLFDHCGPNYNVSGRVCRYDGAVASAGIGGPDPTLDAELERTRLNSRHGTISDGGFCLQKKKPGILKNNPSGRNDRARTGTNGPC